LQEAPVAFFAYDILELNGEDIRNKTLLERRIELEKIVEQVKNNSLQLSPVIDF
jgi:DNA ligase-1